MIQVIFNNNSLKTEETVGKQKLCWEEKYKCGY